MSDRYDHKAIEKKWQDRWDKEKLFEAKEHDTEFGQKFYSLETFPYPSGAGLHVGHPEGYTGEDIQVRYQRMKGRNVLYTMGWDAFGLPTENYAIKVGKNPKEVAAANIANFKRQVKMFGFSYDWSREINTSDPSYYKWTQWLFLQLYKNGLAYFAEAPVNWCPKDQTVLANEQVVDGVCERCQTAVEQRMMKQWFLKITGSDPQGKNGSYPERLLHELEGLDWPEATKIRQREWIGKSEGAELEFAVEDSDLTIKIFTTRADTLFSGTFLVLAPEHPFVAQLTTAEQQEAVANYITQTKLKSELQRTALEKDKTGAFTGSYVLNPATNERMPIWIADFVLGNYGTGAVFADAHDERDFAFAKKYNIPLKTNIKPADGRDDSAIRELQECFPDKGILYDAAEFSGMTSNEALPLIAEKYGKRTIQYRLRDWLVSRQRYWGAPVPMISCEKCGWVPVPEDQLPVLLPDDVDFTPTGVPPLASSKTFINVACPQCGGAAERSAETLDTFVDSSWYYLRYCDANNTEMFADPAKLAYWMPTDLYIIGAEHTVLHLLYSRFITKVLRDLGHLSIEEPFQRLRHIGLILGNDGQKMSKSKGNVVNPDEIVEKFGADTFRLYEMFLGPLQDAKPWNTYSIAGVRRFLERAWYITLESTTDKATPATPEQEQELERWLAKTIKKVTEDIEAFRYNTAISAMMELVNELYRLRETNLPRKDEVLQSLLLLLWPLAPHITAELWTMRFIAAGEIWEQPWPMHNASALQTETVTVVVQVNGKLRGSLTVASGIAEDELVAAAKNEANVAKWLIGKKIMKTIVRAGKLVNFVIVNEE